MSRERKNHTPEEKVAVLKWHLVEKVPVSDLCDELGLNPTVFYGWQKQLFENGAAAHVMLAIFAYDFSSSLQARDTPRHTRPSSNPGSVKCLTPVVIRIRSLSEKR